MMHCEMSMHSLEAMELCYPLPLSSTISMALPLTMPGIATALTASTKWRHTATNIMHRFHHLPLPNQMTQMLLLEQMTPTKPIIYPSSQGNTTLRQGGQV